jgi:hypothetical protein
MNKSIYILIILLCSCSAAKHLQLSEKHRLIAISKGAVIKRDTVYKEVEKRIMVPGDTVRIMVKAEVDIDSFDATMDDYDSTRDYILKLEHDLANGNTIDKEKAMAALRTSNAENIRLKKRLANGFSKDSTYHYQADSVTDIWVTTKGGLVSSVGYNRKRTELTWKEKIPIYIDQKVKAGFNVMELVAGVVFGALLGILIIGIIIVVRGKSEDHV